MTTQWVTPSYQVSVSDDEISVTGALQRMSSTAQFTPLKLVAFRASDGWFVVGVGSQDLWLRFCQAIERPELAHDPRFATNEARVRHREELDRRDHLDSTRQVSPLAAAPPDQACRANETAPSARCRSPPATRQRARPTIRSPRPNAYCRALPRGRGYAGRAACR